MKKTGNHTALVAAFWAVIGVTPIATLAQGIERSEAIASSDVLSQISMFSYREGPKSQLQFRGTPIAATAQGKAQVEYQNGNAQISAKIEDMPKPASLGPYTTYVLWALTPDGRASNKGVIGSAEGGNGEMDTQEGTPQFALVVTAEPHFAVSVPSTMIVLYNVADDVKGAESKVTTLTERADYTRLSAIAIDDEGAPVEIVQARYALAIARSTGADRFATAEFGTAAEKLAAAERAMKGNKSSERKTASGLAREAVIAGEDARRAGILASAAAAVEAQRVAAAVASDEAARQAAAVSEEAARQAAAASNAAAQQAAAVSAEAARQAAAASSDAASAAARVAAAETAAAAEAERQAAAVAARDDLRNRLNAALPTRESSRGLISEIGGVQFATGAATLTEFARENLAKFSGIVASYPTMRFNIEGHTDNTGSDATNNALSLQRAMAVRDYLIGRGVPAASIDVAGMGSSMPIGENAAVDGRARNRRVEIVLSGGPLTASR